MTAAMYAGGAAAAVALAVMGAAWVLSRGRLHRADRVGAAALAVGFVAGYQLVTGGGWHPERAVSWLPMIAVVGALLAPRLATRLAPEARVPLAARAFVLLAAAGAAAAMLAAGRAQAGALALAVLGATLAVALGERLGGDDAGADGERDPTDSERGLARPDRRPGVWVLAALLVGLSPALGA